MAADLAARGFEVKLYNRTAERIREIALRGEIELERENGTFCVGRLATVTSDIAEALDGVEVAMVVVPASGHRDIARMCAPHLREDQIVVLNPGRTGGALEFRQILEREGCTTDPIVAEAGTFIFASRSTGSAQARIFRRKNAVALAALPATRTGHVLEALCDAYPQFIPAPDVLHTSLDNMGAIFHPTLTLLNAGWIERTKGDFQFYIDGITRSTAHVLEVLDRERVTIAAALGVPARPALAWLKDAYSAQGDTLYEAIQANAGYQGIKAPRNLRHRYIELPPTRAHGRRYGLEGAAGQRDPALCAGRPHQPFLRAGPGAPAPLTTPGPAALRTSTPGERRGPGVSHPWFGAFPGHGAVATLPSMAWKGPAAFSSANKCPPRRSATSGSLNAKPEPQLGVQMAHKAILVRHPWIVPHRLIHLFDRGRDKTIRSQNQAVTLGDEAIERKS